MDNKIDIPKSINLFTLANQYIPGGVNSPVRAFKAVGGQPPFIQSAKGAFMYDVDGNSFVDMINSWGPMILGHAFGPVLDAVQDTIKNSLSFGAPSEKEVEMAELICSMVPSIEKVRMVNSGTEATMSAIRLARGFTGRDKIIKFEGCYHGHGDSFLISAGSGVATMGTPDSPGVTKGTANDTLIASYNDAEQVEQLVLDHQKEIAAIIVEPVAGNMGCVAPAGGFLEKLRDICDAYGIVLVFDEVMTGFRLGPAGAQGIYNIQPDLTTLGKIIGGGMPVGAYGGKKEIMNRISPEGPVYQAGTLSGNPVAMAAGIAMLKYLAGNPEVYDQINIISKKIAEGFRDNIRNIGRRYSVNQTGSMISLFFTGQRVSNFTTAKTSDIDMFGRYFNAMLNQGIYLAPSQFESLFISLAITEKLADRIIEANAKSLEEIHRSLE